MLGAIKPGQDRCCASSPNWSAVVCLEPAHLCPTSGLLAKRMLIPHIFHFFSTDRIFENQILHPKND